MGILQLKDSNSHEKNKINKKTNFTKDPDFALYAKRQREAFPILFDSKKLHNQQQEVKECHSNRQKKKLLNNNGNKLKQSQNSTIYKLCSNPIIFADVETKY